jgi:hypothetical protein
MPLLVVAVTPGEGLPGTLSWENGVITFKPRTGYLGLASFDYTIADPLGAQSTATVTIKVVPIPGDLNRDGLVNSRDLDIVRAWWGMSVAPGNLSEGDANGDGKVGSADLDLVRANWGASSVPTGASADDGDEDAGFSSATLIGPRRESPSDAAFSSWRDSSSNRNLPLSLSLSDADLAALPQAAWLREIEGLRGKGKRKGVEQGSLSEMVLMEE